MKISDKRRIQRLLASRDLKALLAKLAELPPIQCINPLFAGICHHDPRIHWHAVMGMGPTVARLAEQDMEAARVVMRRFMWSLNDESGGIGWGAPEAMAEALAHHDKLAAEYTHILVAFMREDGFFLEHEPLQRGLMWGVGRLAAHRRDLLYHWQADQYLPPYLSSPDPAVRGLAARAAGILGLRAARPRLMALASGQHPEEEAVVEVYEPAQDRLIASTVAQLAQQALAKLSA